MCNLYRLAATRDEVAAYFRSIDAWRDEVMIDRTDGANDADQVYPGRPGLVVNVEVLQIMHWGFPRAMKSKKTGAPLKPKAVNNARTDRLTTPFWRDSFTNRRCLIPLTAFAEAEGEAGAMTRTWISVADSPIFCCAGIWRRSVEWGNVYSMVMTDPCDATACVHDRMPVILAPADWRTWCEGTPDDALGLCVPWSGAVEIDRTGEPWSARRPATSPARLQ